VQNLLERHEWYNGQFWLGATSFMESERRRIGSGIIDGREPSCPRAVPRPSTTPRRDAQFGLARRVTAGDPSDGLQIPRLSGRREATTRNTLLRREVRGASRTTTLHRRIRLSRIEYGIQYSSFISRGRRISDSG
jgi:hypothetical protein